jgi:hypothetical protein
MKKISWLFRPSNQPPAIVRCIAGGAGVAMVLVLTAGMAVAQSANDSAQAPGSDGQPSAPAGYTLHESIDLGGRISGVSGSGSMYDTLVNMQSGPRVLGETFRLHALPGTKHTLVDSLTAFSSGWGGAPDDFARMDFYKGNLFDFSGTFTRDRQYFDYDLLGNPNIPSGQSLPIGATGATTGSYPWPQVNQSPFLFNTVRRMTNTNATIFPLSKVSFRAGYAQNIFQGPSLTPSGYQFAGGRTSELLREFQRNSTDDFVGAIDWKPLPQTRLTFEEVIDHYKANSYFTMAPDFQTVQEPDGTVVTLLSGYDSLTPTISCNANSTGTIPKLSAPQTPGGLPVVNPACAVVSSYLRTQPTRILYPTEIFRFQSSSIRNISMNGDVRYTAANMNLPAYYENFQGLSGAARAVTYTANASAKRQVTAVDYGIVWQASSSFSFSDQVTFSNEQEPGTSTLTGDSTTSTPATAGNETINYAGGLTTTSAAAGTAPIEGTAGLGQSQPDFFGQKFVTNDVTGTWDGSRTTLALTYRHREHIIGEGIPHSAPLAVGDTTNGTVTINQNGGILNITLRPTNQWNVDGSAEILYADNVFTPVAPRQLQHYRVHTIYRPKSWATISGAYNDMELHNNTNNNQADIVPPYTGSATGVAYDGPLDHVAHTRVVGLGGALAPSQYYAFDFSYAYSDVYTSTNICYLAGATATLPGAATPSGTVCPATAINRGNTWDSGPTKDFMDAPTQSGSFALSLTPVKRFRSNIGYNISSVDGSRFYNDARDVAGSLVSNYQSPFVNLAWTVHPGFVWNAQYNYYGYGEGGPSGAPYCTTAGPTPTAPSTVVPCNSPTLAGLQTGMTISPAGETAPRDFHSNMITLGFHYEF